MPEINLGRVVGDKGQDGNKWYTGKDITGLSSTPTVYPASGIKSANVGDLYLNNQTGDVYSCVVGGSPTVATWKHEICIGVNSLATYNLKWKKQTMPYKMNSFSKMNDVIVGVGDNGIILYSTDDGSTWNEINNVATYNLKSITNNGDYFVAVGDGLTIMYSSDGISWEKNVHKPSDIGDPLTHNLTFVNKFGNNFLAGGETILISSTNIDSWDINYLMIPDNNVMYHGAYDSVENFVCSLQNVVYFPNGLRTGGESIWSMGVASGINPSDNYIAATIDYANNRFVFAGDNGQILYTNKNFNYFVDGTDEFFECEVSTADKIRDIIKFDDVFILVGDNNFIRYADVNSETLSFKETFDKLEEQSLPLYDNILSANIIDENKKVIFTTSSNDILILEYEQNLMGMISELKNYNELIKGELITSTTSSMTIPIKDERIKTNQVFSIFTLPREHGLNMSYTVTTGCIYVNLSNDSSERTIKIGVKIEGEL